MKQKKKTQILTAALVAVLATFASPLLAAPYSDDAYTVALWHMDEIVQLSPSRVGIRDDNSVSSRSQNNLILGKNTPNDPVNYPTLATGRFGEALLFDSSSQQTAFSDNTWTGSDTAIAQFWINQNAGVTATQTVLHVNGSYEIRVGNGSVTAYVWKKEGGTVSLTATGSYTQGEWTEIAMTINGEDMELIVNGNTFGRTISSGMVNTAGRVQVGSSGAVTRNFDGMIDEMKLSVVPEPATLALMGMGYLALRAKRRTAKKTYTNC